MSEEPTFTTGHAASYPAPAPTPINPTTLLALHKLAEHMAHRNHKKRRKKAALTKVQQSG